MATSLGRGAADADAARAGSGGVAAAAQPLMCVVVSAIARFYLWRVLAPGRFAPRPRTATRPRAAA